MSNFIFEITNLSNVPFIPLVGVLGSEPMGFGRKGKKMICGGFTPFVTLLPSEGNR